MCCNRKFLAVWIVGVWSLLCLPLKGQEVVYINVAGSRGINHVYNGNFLGGGVSFCDFDGDGLEDISLTTGPGVPPALYRNTGSGFTDITGQFNLADVGESETILWADYDNDGDRDLLVVNFFDITRLYRNEADTALVEVTLAAGLSADTLPSTAACWGDFDNDGWLDLLVVNYSHINGVGEVPNILYRNNGDGTFSDVTAAAGVADSTKQPLAAIFVDYDNDGWQDIYLANDKRNGNSLFRNNGDGTFTDVSAVSG
ncbi:MAG: VCBS repeat-containing protein, partial [Calditrichaeota bacterium]